MRLVWLTLLVLVVPPCPWTFLSAMTAQDIGRREAVRNLASITSIAFVRGESDTFTAPSDDDDICRMGLLVPEQAVPGAYQQRCMNIPERIVDLSPGFSPPLVIKQGASGSGRTGLAVWNSGLLLARLLADMTPRLNPNEFKWNETRVLEIGCGAGLASLVAHRLGAASVVATDGNPEVLELTQENIEKNRRQNGKGKISSQVLQWGLLSAMDFSESADLVLGSDLTYNSGTWRVLAETMATVVSDSGHILYLSLGHDGFNVESEMDGFLSVARAQGLEVVPELAGISLQSVLFDLLQPAEVKMVKQSGLRVIILRKKQVKTKFSVSTRKT